MFMLDLSEVLVLYPNVYQYWTSTRSVAKFGMTHVAFLYELGSRLFFFAFTEVKISEWNIYRQKSAKSGATFDYFKAISRHFS